MLQTEYVEAERLINATLTNTHQLEVVFDGGGEQFGKITYRGAVQKIHNNNDGEAIGYEVYVY